VTWSLAWAVVVGMLVAHYVLESNAAVDPRYFSTSNGRIATPSPEAGRAWRRVEDYREGDGFTLTEVKWSTTYKEGQVFLYAKDYALRRTGTPGSPETVASVCGRDWRAYYHSVLPTVLLLDNAQDVYLGHQSCHVTAEGTSAEGISLRLDEHYIVIPGHVLLLSAAGPTTRILFLAQTIDSWFGRVRFKAIARS